MSPTKKDKKKLTHRYKQRIIEDIKINIWKETDNCKRCRAIYLEVMGKKVTKEDCEACEDRPEEKL